MKKQVYFLIIIVLISFFIFSKINLTGFATYGAVGDFPHSCQVDISEDSSFLEDQYCNDDLVNGLYGPNLISPLTLNCNSKSIIGFGFYFGIKTTADNIILKKCIITNFAYNLNISSNNVKLVDSVLTAATTKEAFINSGVNATFLNVTFNSANLEILANSNLSVQYYVIVNITNSSNAPVEGATVNVSNSSIYASNFIEQTNSNGLAYFNITERLIYNSGATTTEFIYNISANVTGNSTSNSAVDITSTTSFYLVSLQVDSTEADTTSPEVTINSPTGTYTTDSYLVNITINENGYCEFSLDKGITNETLSTTDNLNFNATKSSISNADYVLYAYCNDTIGNRNDSVNSSFTVSVAAEEIPSSPPGGGGGCTVTSWNCTSWSSCINLNQTRACTSNCNTKKNETQACTNNLVEENKTTEIIPEQEKPKQEQKPLFDFSKLKNKKIIITAAITVTTITIVSVSIWAWLWALSIIPFFLLRLRHYSVSIFDTKNYLGFIDKNGKVNSSQVVEFIQKIKKNVKGPLTLAGRKENTVRFLFEKGFLEVQVNSPPILMAHFSDKASALEFKKALILAINILPKESRVVKEQIIEVIEKESIFSLFREYSRKAETERQLKKMQD